ncbi:Uncharacterized protein HZ326_25665 [Fusarium oxysporum f. sp. albedinis]|nr:Uncharacterized protein HZ326_25665 [Fusarium oxysporum f. sp. albedinis]
MFGPHRTERPSIHWGAMILSACWVLSIDRNESNVIKACRSPDVRLSLSDIVVLVAKTREEPQVDAVTTGVLEYLTSDVFLLSFKDAFKRLIFIFFNQLDAFTVRRAQHTRQKCGFFS